LIPRIIKFFGQLALKGDFEVSLIEKNNCLIGIKKALEGKFEEQESAITSIGQIGSLPSGLILISNANLINHYVDFLNKEGDLRICSFHSIAFLLTNIIKFDKTQQIQKLLQNLVLEIPTRRTIQTIVHIVMPLFSNPFPDLRYSLFDCLNGLSYHDWGLKEELNYPGFF